MFIDEKKNSMTFSCYTILVFLKKYTTKENLQIFSQDKEIGSVNIYISRIQSESVNKKNPLIETSWLFH